MSIYLGACLNMHRRERYTHAPVVKIDFFFFSVFVNSFVCLKFKIKNENVLSWSPPETFTTHWFIWTPLCVDLRRQRVLACCCCYPSWLFADVHAKANQPKTNSLELKRRHIPQQVEKFLIISNKDLSIYFINFILKKAEIINSYSK